ncbi:uncharacterized protein B0H18DRAFT_1113018 [Fomitopsis serialis]|uniref:uncharacterized protein n=1 Tax=Fomitopsis serialis TaxID=139415 RepID=UPI002007555F|nr:uncharacterized protein B0H18DRAFT_1113018 [Neoantrodia serialis]KAH9937146.1 hypothetical protein B0H18DRAFT_1113018 [Neoantrodia serialis]
MATAAPARATPASRRSPSVSSTAPTTPAASIARGATARSAVSPRVTASMNSTAAARRGSLKGATPPASIVNGEARETRESLSAHLKEETEKKEQLLVQLQDKDQTITTLTTENDNLNSALKAAESRLAEMYAEQNRMEEEMGARIDISEKLRTQVRDLEKDKRDIQRRYNEQATTFEAERQAFYDNEQHLKSRIQSLTQTRKQPVLPLTSPSVASIAETEIGEEAGAEAVAQEGPDGTSQADKQDINDPEQEPAEMTALKLELSTLSTSYSSLQQTLVLLQTQLIDLKRVNNELQEENESYNILLRERTLNGQFDILRMGGGTSVSEASASETGDDDDVERDSRDGESLKSRNTGRSVLDPVEELTENELDPAFQQDGEQDQEGSEKGEPAPSVRRHARRHSKSHSPQTRGESLANLPITGPGLDLAAELGRAENKDILEGRAPLENEQIVPGARHKKGRKASDTTRKISVASEPGMDTGAVDDLDALRIEVKSLKDANKALSLYASKIIDRIISQEGFEHVLAVDYDSKAPMTPNTAATFTTFSKPPAVNGQPAKKGRPQSAVFSFSSSTSQTPPMSPGLTTFNSPLTPNTATSSPPKPPASARASRRSLSFDWKSFSMFGGGEKKPEPNPNLKPLTLRAGSSPVVTGARKLDTLEDEEDRRERERLHATMKLMGIEKPPMVQKSHSAPSDPARPGAIDTAMNSPVTASTVTPVNPPTPSSRFSFFRRTPSMTSSDASSARSSAQGSPYVSGGNTPNLTQEALEQAEAEGAIAALEAHERHLSAEIAQGSPGGFTEVPRRSSDRRSSRKSGSGSTVWSAGMSKGEDGDD